LLLFVFVCLSFGREPIDYLRPRNDLAQANSFGRLAFLAAIFTMYAATFRLLRSRGIVAKYLASGKIAGKWRIRLWLPVLSVGMLSAALLAITGYYLTAFVLTRLSVATGFLLGSVCLATVMCVQWSALASRRREAGNGVSAAIAQQEVTTGDGVSPDETGDLQAAQEQARRFFRLTAATIFVVGSILIWSDLLPSFKVLQRVQIWPAMTVISEKDFAARATAAAPPQAPPVKGGAESDGGAASRRGSPGGILNPAQLSVPGSSVPGSSVVSLADLLTALLIVLGTAIIARNLPGLLQFLLQRPVPNSGDRNAISTIIKYLVIIIGMAAAMRQFGLKWSQIQWMAAAFSFGLAFGLQEVFANFVSGLIILVERPMAIGDFCRFGTNLGTIESIGLRSTRVRAVDRTVITVPNAEFSKREVVNFARRDRMLVQATLCLRYETSEDQLRFLLVRLWELLIAHPAILEEDARVRFCGFGTHSLNIEVFAYADCRDYGQFLAIREDLFLRIIETIKQAGTDFALPAQTTYFARDGGLNSERRQAAESEIAGLRAGSTMPLSEVSESRRRAIRNTIDFPCPGTHGLTAARPNSPRK
jgi:small-conductance mechanosensitive channel